MDDFYKKLSVGIGNILDSMPIFKGAKKQPPWMTLNGRYAFCCRKGTFTPLTCRYFHSSIFHSCIFSAPRVLFMYSFWNIAIPYAGNNHYFYVSPVFNALPHWERSHRNFVAVTWCDKTNVLTGPPVGEKIDLTISLEFPEHTPRSPTARWRITQNYIKQRSNKKANRYRQDTVIRSASGDLSSRHFSTANKITSKCWLCSCSCIHLRH